MANPKNKLKAKLPLFPKTIKKQASQTRGFYMYIKLCLKKLPASGKTKMSTCFGTFMLQIGKKMENFLSLFVAGVELGSGYDVCSESGHVLAYFELPPSQIHLLF